MRVQASVYHMTDRELRAYKWKLRRQRELRRKVMIIALTVCLVIMGTVSYHALRSSANSGEENLRFKYYTAVTVQSGETLWDIADLYIDYAQYADKQTYVAEVCHINHLDEDAAIRSGQRLVVPYYADEFVK
ncbi:MAG: LysM peptidoglycan-binding domain-containing protein [Candidatus Gastranaerophilales bacterium]|nr:LysM peptidoglycan-binding domain-containing protein [Candidatus Gastranaerophilales bacterium]